MMTIKQIDVTVGEITKGYINNDEQGVRGYGGLLAWIFHAIQRM